VGDAVTNLRLELAVGARCCMKFRQGWWRLEVVSFRWCSTMAAETLGAEMVSSWNESLSRHREQQLRVLRETLKLNQR
jgi:hypothetical protein